ncbi:MAG: cobalamin-dependent protein [Candidatus Krumholzibacteriota bacterium]|nr:cobalamin-dependent protein [Candidatus Krumholzibacteriota bacterium]
MSTMPEENTRTRPRHAIGFVARRTGIPPDLLRAWERRYGVVEPGRGPRGRRLYSDADVERLTLLRRAVDAGRRIGDVAGMDNAELAALVEEDRRVMVERPGRPAGASPPPGTSAQAGAYLDAALAAVAALDHVGLVEVMDEAAVALGRRALRRELIAPLLERVGEDWYGGRLRVAHEHLLSAVLRGVLEPMHRDASLPETAPRVVVTTPAGELHELGALMAAAAAVERGWRVVYLGPNLPAEEIAGAARQAAARAAALSLVANPGNAQTANELRRLRRLVGKDLAIYVGGAAASSYDSVLDELGIVRVNGAEDFPAPPADL